MKITRRTKGPEEGSDTTLWEVSTFERPGASWVLTLGVSRADRTSGTAAEPSRPARPRRCTYTGVRVSRGSLAPGPPPPPPSGGSRCWRSYGHTLQESATGVSQYLMLRQPFKLFLLLIVVSEVISVYIHIYSKIYCSFACKGFIFMLIQQVLPVANSEGKR